MKDKKPKDYRPFFILGCSLLAVGISLISSGPAFLSFLGAGVVFMAIGLSNNDNGRPRGKLARCNNNGR